MSKQIRVDKEVYNRLQTIKDEGELRSFSVVVKRALDGEINPQEKGAE
jgi:predicted CopG family antitoxin